ncbi:hypothetical protein EX30DRAFT_40202 [Ascodesmis nigricans]|uniref:Uncharacterized protein n=1 Tax=Ascodesmis nigricans TaxID=341454 RepID=A0A4S2MW51_9PEZI|nr:hypothetical protein EX30DRAFT_40202 [Ascodesmis nigricans]
MEKAHPDSFPLLLKTLPQYASRMATLLQRFDVALADVEPVNPGLPDEKPKERPSTPSSAQKREMQKFVAGESMDAPRESGNKKLLQKPGQNKARFSALDGPEIMYDGASQNSFFEVWTQLNSDRGVLRKEMMQYKRKKVMMPVAGFGYDSEDDLSADDESEEEEESEAAQLKRIEDEKRKREEEKKKAEQDKLISEVLEYIDGRLDRAVKACENAAFLWLKGEGVPGHILFLNHRLYEAMVRIHTVYTPPPPPPADDVMEDDTDDFALGAVEEDDEGLGCVDAECDDDSETELRHKEPANRRVPKMPDPPH